MNEKAYKLLAVQEAISNGEAKRLIDDGFVYVGGKRLEIARSELSVDTVFKIEKPKPIETLYEDDEMIAIDKPRGAESYAVEKRLGLKLVHRLDKETSGVLCLAKSDEFLQRAIDEFKRRKTIKRYLAVVNGAVTEERVINLPVLTFKGAQAKSVIDEKRGREAITIIKPLQFEGKRSLLEVAIPTGRAHQIRVHLSHIGLPILGDLRYGGKPYKRLMLHSVYISLLGREISAERPKEFVELFGA
ncbi:MAG: RluA family pseudouridine synthase [Helicobacteraceae bacterium]|jgi:23S rRNA-/tRNA-specific pseudouridylate synthase|nr:RluA family pseudouridine synthase [Helicobacteraceae bacterium]